MAKWNDIRRFLENDGYVFVRHGSRHDIYEKQLPDGTVQRVTVSRGTGEISPGLFSRILKQQLKVTKEEFYRVLKKKSR